MTYEDRLRETFRQEAGALEHRRVDRPSTRPARSAGRSGKRRIGLAFASAFAVLAALIGGSFLLANVTSTASDPVEVEVTVADDGGATEPVVESDVEPLDPSEDVAPLTTEPAEGQLPSPVPTATPVPPEPCRPLVGFDPWITLHDPDAQPGCVAIAEFQQPRIFNKGFDATVITWVDGARRLGSDDSFTFNASDLGVGIHDFASDPYAMPQIHVRARADSEFADWEKTDTGFGPVLFNGISLREATVALQVPFVPYELEFETCQAFTLDHDPYSPLLFFAPDGPLISVIAADDVDTAVPFQCGLGPDTEPGAPVHACNDHQLPGFFVAMVRNVATDDPDGGLVVHSTPSVETPVIGVLPHDAVGIQLTGECMGVGDGAVWWEIDYFGTPGWANAFYLFAPEELPTCGEHGVVDPLRAQEGFESFATVDTDATNERVAAITHEVHGECIAVVITLGEGEVVDGVSDVSAQAMGGIEVSSFNHATVVSFPDSFRTDVQETYPAMITGWSVPSDGRPGVAVHAAEGEDRYVFISNNSTELPTMVTASDPARLIISFFDNAPVVDGFIPSGGMFVSPIEQIEPDKVFVQGIGAGFEGSAGVYVFDSNDQAVEEAVFSGPSIFESQRAGSGILQVGSPSAIYIPFEFMVSELPPGDYKVVFDSCAGQCTPQEEQPGVVFSVG